MKKLLLLLILTTVFITGCSQQETTSTKDFRGEIQAQDELLYDFGSIDINGGIVSKTFQFKNTDSKPLAIYEATTSCGCTTGEIKVGSKTYGPFGMHNQTKQTIEVPAQSDFSVTISYDPLFHGPTDLGKRERTLFLFSSAKVDGEVVRNYQGKPNFTEISVRGNVIKN